MKVARQLALALGLLVGAASVARAGTEPAPGADVPGRQSPDAGASGSSAAAQSYGPNQSSGKGAIAADASSAAQAVAPVEAQAAASHVIPALTPISIVIDVDLGSKISKTGETFPFHLAEPIVIDGVAVIPAGTPGQGEVVHAKKSGGSGAPGELVLAARFLQVGDRQLRLRSLKLDPIVDDKMGTVQTINVATAATIPAVALVGFFITGGQKNVAKGTILPAKTAEPFEYGPSVALPAPAPVAAGQGETGETRR